MAKPKVAVWVGTRKGTYALASDEHRRKWSVRGPYHAGNDVFHVVADPREPRYVYALVNSGWFGPRVFRSKDAGVRWTEVAPPMMALGKDRDHDEMGAAKPGPIVNLWHLTRARRTSRVRSSSGSTPGCCSARTTGRRAGPRWTG